MADETSGAIGIAAGGATLAAGVVAKDPLTAGAGVLAIVQQLREFNGARQVRIVKELLETTYGQVSTDRGALAEYKGLLEGGDLKSEKAKAVFLQTVRAAEGSVDESVYPALAMLMREYVREGRSADGFFRGVSRTLQDLSADEYKGLRAIVLGVVEWPGPTSVVRRLRVIPTGYVVQVTDPGTSKARGAKDVACLQEHAAHIFHLLDVNDLAEWQTDLIAVGADSAETHAIAMHQDVAKRIATLIAPAEV